MVAITFQQHTASISSNFFFFKKGTMLDLNIYLYLFIFYLFIYIFIYFILIYLFTYIYLFIFIYIYLFIFIYLFLFIYLWLCWIFVSVRGLSPVAASGGHSSSRCAGLSLSQPLLLWSTSSRHAGSVVVAHGPSCSAACGIFPNQGSNPCPLHWQADSQLLRHQGSPQVIFIWRQQQHCLWAHVSHHHI